VLPDGLDKPCFWLARFLYKFCAHAEVSRSAHSFLWIYMGLSTVGGGKQTSIDLPDRQTGEQSLVFQLASMLEGQHSVMCSFLPTVELATKIFFFERAARSTSGLQPKSVYKDSSSVNNCPFLWISQLTDEKSSVYARYKPVICCCMFLVANLDKNRGCGKSRVFAQSVPVDIKKLIHSCATGAAFTIW